MAGGYAFIHFRTKEATDKAVEKMNGMLLNDLKVFVGRFKTQKSRKSVEPKPSSPIKNFGKEVDDENLKELFSQLGQSLKCQGDDRSQWEIQRLWLCELLKTRGCQ
ncbi:LOW QUALITY PROTEIN: hypothetical protein QTO34_010636 [Cnephaeus nilssonii]|uniref:RRM domain-containing protein n=1 Tax=Cnephaeus nilssonii TaxID=3371016 RepID=A0AA40HGK7_CNENI|nr:LOW QUALITY PROTEIN: hypothetical protein QTO34_010636 [Eptesicus nilssonii]